MAVYFADCLLLDTSGANTYQVISFLKAAQSPAFLSDGQSQRRFTHRSADTSTAPRPD